MSRPLQVGIDARMRPDLFGGVSTVVIGLASGLARLPDGDEEYAFLVDAQYGSDWLEPYLDGRSRVLTTVTSRRPLRRKLRSAARRAHWRIRPEARRRLEVPRSDGTVERAGLDVMHFVRQTGFLTTVPTLFNPHDLQHVHLPHLFEPHKVRTRTELYRLLGERASIVGVQTTWVKEDVMRHLGVPEEKIRIVPLAPILDAYPTPTAADRARARETLCLPDAFVYYPAQTWPHKNHLRLLEALALLRDRHGVDVQLVSSGRKDDAFFGTIERRVEELELGGQVRFLGFVDPLEVRCLYELCRCVVIPTRFEANSLPLWEAFLAGAPAACSNVTSLPAQAGDAALVFDPDDVSGMAEAVRRLWTDEELRRTLAARGRTNVARFSWERTARTYRALYRDIGGRALDEDDRELLAAPPPF